MPDSHRKVIASVTMKTSRETAVAGGVAIAFLKQPMEHMDFTDLQGQYLSYIYNYSVIHGSAPSEADFRSFFGTTPPTIHNMILTLEKKGLIGRVPGQARSIRLLVLPQRLPMLRPATRQRP